jgi:hypothetical protein
MTHWSRAERKTLYILTFWSVVATASIAAVNWLVIINILQSQSEPTQQRALASQTLEAKQEKNHPPAPTIQWDCGLSGQTSHHRTFASNARFVLKNCPNPAKMVNHTNKNQGHFFALNDGFFTSDFIHLQEGPNKIRFHWQGGSQDFEITRESKNKTTASTPL